MMSPIELIAVFTAILYLVLAVRQNILCWSAWIISSCLYFFIMFQANLYMESVLQIFYVIMGIYGWKQWSKGDVEVDFEVNTMTFRDHVKIVSCILALSIFFGFILEQFTNAALPFWDSLTTWGAVITTYLVAKKFIENWIYWFVIDFVSVFLFVSRDLYLTAGLFFVYLIIICFGYSAWKKEMESDRDLRIFKQYRWIGIFIFHQRGSL